MDADGAVDAENAPTAPWKSLSDFHKRPQPLSSFGENRKDKRMSRLRAGQDSDDTHSAYRVAAFQTFLSGRISTFGDTDRSATWRDEVPLMGNPTEVAGFLGATATRSLESHRGCQVHEVGSGGNHRAVP